MKLTLNGLSEVEEAIFRAFTWTPNRPLNPQRVYNRVNAILLIQHLSKDSRLFDELKTLKDLKVDETYEYFSKLRSKYDLDFPSYPRVQRYLERFVENGWIEKRKQSEKSFVYWIKDESREQLLKENPRFFNTSLLRVSKEFAKELFH